MGLPVMHDQIFDFNIDLPVRIKINNSFLGSKCYIGSSEDPVSFELAWGQSGHFEPPGLRSARRARLSGRDVEDQ